MRTQIQIKQVVNGVTTITGYLDLSNDISVPLNFSVAEIQDISKKNGSYSKTIVVPGSSNNNKLLNHLFDVNIVTSSFQQNKKADCIILQNGIPVFEGIMKLLDVNKLSPALPNGDQNVEYNVQITNDNADFFSTISDRLLQDLSFSSFDHTYTWDNVTATSANTYTNVYKYHMMDNMGKPYYTLTDFTPSIFARAYWDRIFADAGFSYEFDSSIVEIFNRLVIPWNGDVPKGNEDEYKVTAGYSGTTGQALMQIGASSGTTGAAISGCRDYEIDAVYQPLIFSETILDATSSYSNVNGSFTAPFDYTDLTFNINFDYIIYLNNNTNADDIRTRGPGRVTVIHQIIENSNFALFPPLSNTTVVDNEFTELNYPLNTNVEVARGITSFQVKLKDILAGTTLYQALKGSFSTIDPDGLPCPNYSWVNTAGLAFRNPPNMYIELGVLNISNVNNNSINIIPNTTLGENQTVKLDLFVPTKIKQKDFIASIIKMFNLYVEPSKINDKKLIFQTRDTYYSQGTVLDWTPKLDINKDVNIQFLPDLQNKKLLLTYKQDSDIYNKNYLEATGDIYGQYEYEFDNDFVKDTKRIELIFSPTPLVQNFFGDIVPGINSTAPKNNIRLLFDAEDWIDSKGWRYVPSQEIGPITSGITSGSTLYTTYPYAGHFNDPIFPFLDINFGLCDYYYYDSWFGESIIDNNLYNNFYKNYIAQIETGKLLTGYFLLNELDIQQLNFRDKIFIHDNYYYLNKVIDYNANNVQVTKVELISVEETANFFAELQNVSKTGGRYNNLNNENSITNSSTTNIFGNNVSLTDVRGFNNIIQSNTIAGKVLGNNNLFGGIGNSVQGNNNKVFGNNNSYFGTNATVDGNNLFVIGGDASGSTYTGTSAIFLNLPVYIGSDQTNSFLLNSSITGGTLFTAGSGVGAIRATLYPTPTTVPVNASGDYAFAMGDEAEATGDHSFAFGFQVLASGVGSHAEGAVNQATGNYSHVEGAENFAIGESSHAEGNLNTASGDFSHAEGESTIASNDASHAEGRNTEASGIWSHAEGRNTVASASTSHAEGSQTIAGGFASHSEGQQTIASGAASHAEGYLTLASNLASHAEGVSTIASGTASHAEGEDTIASGSTSHAEGSATIASGSASHAEGSGTTASGLNSHAEGRATIASGNNSHAGGNGTFAIGENSFIHSAVSTVTGLNSVVLGGSGITGSTDNTVYTSYLVPLITVYANDAAADADTALAAGGLYRVTGSRIVYQKP